MAKSLLKERNQAVKVYFADLCKKNPQWRLDALEIEAAKKFYITPRTIRAILKEEGSYAVN